MAQQNVNVKGAPTKPTTASAQKTKHVFSCGEHDEFSSKLKWFNPSKKYIEGIISNIKEVFPDGAKIPAMTADEINNLSFFELNILNAKARFILASGYCHVLSFSESYLNLYLSAYRKKYSEVIKNNFRVVENGKIIAAYGYKGCQYGVYRLDEKHDSPIRWVNGDKDLF